MILDVKMCTHVDVFRPAPVRCFWVAAFPQQAMLSTNPGNEQSLRELLSSLQEDFVVFTKPAEKSGGQPMYLAL